MIWALSNWRLIAGGAFVAALLGLAIYVKTHLNYVERLEGELETLSGNVATLTANSANKDAEIIRLQTEAAETIKLVEIVAIRRVETMETSRAILKDLPDEDPMCGPWQQYFTNVVRQTPSDGD